MHKLAVALLLILCLLLVWVLGLGGSGQVGAWAVATQRDVQNAMAASLRAFRAGDTGALMGLWLLCFTYGFVHAVGPGHGKLVIGGYGLAARVPAVRLVGLAVASSIAQAMTAILLVYVAIFVLGWGRAQLADMADRTLAPLSYAMIIGVGVWVLLRGARRVWNSRQRPADHEHHGDGVCSSCGHAHGPTVEQAQSVRSFRDAIALILAIAIRPCTGAIFLLVLTYALGIHWAGISGAIMMGLGTASFTAMVALTSVAARESALAQIGASRVTVRLFAVVEMLAGAVIAGLALQLLVRTI